MQLVQDLEATQAELEALEAPEQLRWANDHFGSGFAVTTSFGTQSAVLLHLLVGVAPDVPVYWIDTGYLFPETYQYAADLTQRLKLNLKVVQPELSPARMEALLGRLWESENPDDLVTYHRLRKVEPWIRPWMQPRSAVGPAVCGLVKPITVPRCGRLNGCGAVGVCGRCCAGPGATSTTTWRSTSCPSTPCLSRATAPWGLALQCAR